ncbi:MAG: hypothetical protein DWI00_01500 [Planctomycetota bacterium]|nr:MAG: hypothetical protein DWI00_01500 [Planctomycetota bacterium]
MKLHKGKLSTSNAVVIGVLVIVLYLVMPGGSEKTRSKNTDVSATEAPIVASSDTAAPDHSNALPDQEQNLSRPGNQRESVGLAAAPARIRPLMEIDEEKLQEIADRSPFCTAVVMVRPVDSSEPDTLTKAIAEPANDEIFHAAELISKSTVKLFYSSSTGRQAAVLNDDIVYRGTSVSDKLTVESIQPDGVRIRHSALTPQTEK